MPDPRLVAAAKKRRKVGGKRFNEDIIERARNHDAIERARNAHAQAVIDYAQRPSNVPKRHTVGEKYVDEVNQSRYKPKEPGAIPVDSWNKEVAGPRATSDPTSSYNVNRRKVEEVEGEIRRAGRAVSPQFDYIDEDKVKRRAAEILAAERAKIIARKNAEAANTARMADYEKGLNYEEDVKKGKPSIILHTKPKRFGLTEDKRISEVEEEEAGAYEGEEEFKNNRAGERKENAYIKVTDKEGNTKIAESDKYKGSGLTAGIVAARKRREDAARRR